MGIVVSSSLVLSAAPSSSGGGLLTFFPCSSMRSLSHETVVHELLQHQSFPQAAALHRLPQRGSLPMGCSPSGTGCSSVGPPRGHKPSQQNFSGIGSSLHGSAGPGRSLLQHGLPTGSQPPSGIHLLQCRVPSMGYRCRSAPPWTSTGCRGTACLTTVCSMGCMGISALGLEHLLPSLFTDLGVCRVVSLTSSHSL